MYHVRAQGIDEHMTNVHYYYYYYFNTHDKSINFEELEEDRAC